MSDLNEMVPAIDGTMIWHGINADGTVREKHCCGCWVIDRKEYIATCNECGETRDMAFYPLIQPQKVPPLYSPDEGKFNGADIGLGKPLNVSPWFPIETAPKDGTRVLLYGFDGYEAIFGVWNKQWVWADYLSNRSQPTHWMPSPEPPKEPTQ